jgi:hypothetical protein
MSGGMGVNAGKLGAYPPMIPAHGRYSLGFVDRQPRRWIGIVLGIVLQYVSHPSAQRANRSFSIPHVTLIDFDFMLLANPAELLLEGHRPMVFGLTRDAIDHLRHCRLADRERAVAVRCKAWLGVMVNLISAKTASMLRDTVPRLSSSGRAV